jgi:hypothetical protein
VICCSGFRPDKEQFSTDNVVDLVDLLHGIHHSVRQQLKVASDRMKALCDRLANSARFQEGDKVWLYRPTPRTRGKSPKLQPSLEGPCKVITRINDVICCIQRHPRAKIKVVYEHLIRLAPCLGLLGTSSLNEEAVSQITPPQHCIQPVGEVCVLRVPAVLPVVPNEAEHFRS